MGSVVGTIKSFVQKEKNKDLAVLKIKTYRPLPFEEINKVVKNAKNIAVLEKAVNFGTFGSLYLDINMSANKQIIKNFIGGLGGKDIGEKDIAKIVKNFNKHKKLTFI